MADSRFHRYWPGSANIQFECPLQPLSSFTAGAKVEWWVRARITEWSDCVLAKSPAGPSGFWNEHTHLRVLRHTQLTPYALKYEHLCCCCVSLTVCPCILQPRHDKTLGGWTGGPKGEQCQANGSSAGVHSQRQTVETTTGCLPGGGRETTQKGERWGAELLALFYVLLIHTNKVEQPFGRDGVKSR